MEYTANLGLKKPAYSDPADIADLNGNMDIVDKEVSLINEAVVLGNNLFDDSTVVDGGYYSSTGGISSNVNSQYSTQYIEVEPSTVYSYSYQPETQLVYCEYDSDKTFLRRTVLGQGIKFTTSADAKFIRLSMYLGSLSDDFMLNKGNTLKPYESYHRYLDVNKIDNLKESNILFSKKDIVFNAASEYDDTYTDYYAQTYGLVANAGYSSWGLTLTKDVDCYFTSKNEKYASICVYPSKDHMYGGSLYRYKDAGQEDTLPTIDNPLHISAGNYVVFTVNHAVNISFACVFPEYGITLGNDIVLADSQVEQVRNAIKAKKSYLQYVTGGGSISEKVYVYIPNNENGYIRHSFDHIVNNSLNADVWHMGTSYLVDDGFSEVLQLTTGGEWECAIHLYDRPDYMGGYAHGDEVKASIEFLIDGELVDITDYTDMTSFDDFRVIQASRLYDPNDSTTNVAIHGSERIFGEKLIINQSVKWLVQSTVDGAYLAMGLMSKAAVDKMYTDADYTPVDLSDMSSYQMTYYGVKKISQYSDSTGVYFSIECDADHSISCRDNSGGDYHKCYFNYIPVVQSGTTIEADTVWKNRTEYYFAVAEQTS